MTTQDKILDHGIYGFAIALPGEAKVCKFVKVIPLTEDAVIDAITFPEHPLEAGIPYHGDDEIIGVPLPRGAVLPIAGTSITCLLYTSPSPRDGATSRMPSSA